METRRRWTAMMMSVMALALLFTPVPGAQPHEPWPATAKFRRTKEPVKDHYLIVLQDEVEAARMASIAEEIVSTYRGTIRFTYTHALKGFAVVMSEAAAERLSRDPRVKYVEETAVMRVR